jgi:Lipocalin-like domain
MLHGGSCLKEIRYGMISDSELRQALLGTWRLVSLQTEVDGTLVKPLGESPHGYLVYTSDGHVVVQFAARERAELLGSSPGKGRVLLETAKANTPFGFIGYSGTFEVRDSQAIHHVEINVVPSASGNTEVRSVELNGDRLTLVGPPTRRLEWQRVH